MKMQERLSLIAPPLIEPVSVAEAMAHLRLESEAEAALLHGQIRAAREIIEAWTERALITQSWRLFLDRWPAGPGDEAWWDGVRQGAMAQGTARFIEIPKPPLRSIDLVALFDDADQQTTWPAANYFADTAGMPGRVVLRNGVSAPSAGRAAGGVQISFTCGYGDSAGDVPSPLRQAMLLLSAHFYEQREVLQPAPGMTAAPLGVRALLAPYRAARL